MLRSRKRKSSSEEKFRQLMDEHAGKFTAMMGAEAIKQLLKQIDIEELVHRASPQDEDRELRSRRN